MLAETKPDKPKAAEAAIDLAQSRELTQDPAARKPFDASAGVGPRIQAAALENGLIVRSIRDAVAVCPPLIITMTQIDELFDKFERALDAGLEHARAGGWVD